MLVTYSLSPKTYIQKACPASQTAANSTLGANVALIKQTFTGSKALAAPISAYCAPQISFSKKRTPDPLKAEKEQATRELVATDIQSLNQKKRISALYDLYSYPHKKKADRQAINRTIEAGFNDPELEVKKTALAVLTLHSKDEANDQLKIDSILDTAVKDEELRSAALTDKNLNLHSNPERLLETAAQNYDDRIKETFFMLYKTKIKHKALNPM